jgi:hypothetical protein
VTLHAKVEAGTPTFVAGYETTPWGAGGWTINVPATVQEGDLGFIIMGRDAGDAIVATDPAGWTRIIPDTVATNSNWRILTRVRQNGDASTIAFGGTVTGTVVAFWYRNALLGAVGTRWIRSGTAATITCPSLERSVAGSVLLAIGGDRSIAATAGEQGYTSVTGATYARRYEGNPTLSAGTQICATWYAEIAPASPPSDVVWTLNDSATNAFGMQIELVPSAVWRKVSQPKLKLTNAWRDAVAVYTKVNGEWREVWPGNAGAVKILGPEYVGQSVRVPEPAWSATSKYFPAGTPMYTVVGDKDRIYSARVELKFTPSAPKSPVEQIISWDVTNDWGIYMICWRVDASTVKYYYAGMKHTEAAAIVAPKYAVQMWSPRDGGRFAYMPVCFDTTGLTVPLRDDAAGGLDSHSGYDPFPPGRSAIKTSDSTPVTFSDYSVANGYTDQEANNGFYGYSAPGMTLATIILRDVNGATLASWGPAALAYTGIKPDHVPGLGIGPETRASALSVPTTNAVVTKSELYWPVEWRGLFSNVYGQVIGFGQDVLEGNTAGCAEWWVYNDVGDRIGDFKLGLRKGITDTIEIHGVNLAPDLVGMGIMKAIVHHGTIWSPTRFVVLEPPNQPTYDVMRGWGWQKLEEAPAKSSSAAFYKVFDPRETDRYLIYDTHVPMYNRFSELGFPPLEEVVQW